MTRAAIPPDQYRRIPDATDVLRWYERLIAGAPVTRDPPRLGAPKRRKRPGLWKKGRP